MPMEDPGSVNDLHYMYMYVTIVQVTTSLNKLVWLYKLQQNAHKLEWLFGALHMCHILACTKSLTIQLIYSVAFNVLAIPLTT